MPTDPLRLYCPVCDQDFALEAFSSHVEFPKHIQAVAWAQRATVEHLITIGALLQQLVAEDQQETPPFESDAWHKCQPCGWATLSSAAYEFHCETPGHKAQVAKGQQVTPPAWMSARYQCLVCQLGWETYEEADAHWNSGEHERRVANAAATR